MPCSGVALPSPKLSFVTAPVHPCRLRPPSFWTAIRSGLKESAFTHGDFCSLAIPYERQQLKGNQRKSRQIVPLKIKTAHPTFHPPHYALISAGRDNPGAPPPTNITYGFCSGVRIATNYGLIVSRVSCQATLPGNRQSGGRELHEPRRLDLCVCVV